MPLGRWVARLNRRGLNRLTVHIAPWAPGFGVIEHVGRRSGRTFRTPINVFPHEQGYLIALTYGPNSDWVRNVITAGGGRLTTRRRRYRLTDPRLLHTDRPQRLPLIVRTLLRWTKVHDYLLVDASADASPDTSPDESPDPAT